MLEDVKTNVLKGKMKKIEGVVQETLDEGVPAQDILDAMIETMGVIGDKFQNNEIFVPEMLISARTMKKGVEVLRPLLTGDAVTKLGKVIIGTVKGDLHDIGKNLVAIMIESAGFEIVDLGVDVPPEAFVEALKENPDCKIIGISALLTTTMDSMRATVEAIKEAGLRDSVKIMVGGAPITQAFCDEIGADVYTTDAGSAAKAAKEIVA